MTNSHTQKAKWIETGYQQFSEHGPHKLKIKSIAKDAGVSRTTFYHFFTDMEDFISELLKYHRNLAREYFSELEKCQVYDPDIFKVVERFRTGIFFHRQLLVHKENPTFYLTYKVLNRIGNKIIYPLWVKNFGYQGNSLIGREIHQMLVDLWYLNLQKEDFTFEAFRKNSDEIKKQLEAFADSHHIQALGQEHSAI